MGEQPFRWQITNLQSSVGELHDAPILYITAETPPQFNPDEKRKLREFTDTGGTILFEASCGAPAVREYFSALAKELWPEWGLKPLGPDHATYISPHRLEQRPEVMGVDDGLRTCVFLAVDDVSCPWQTRGYAGKEYLFKWGINLYQYATDHSPTRTTLEGSRPPKFEKYTTTVRSGGATSLRLARLKTGGDWTVGRHYKGLEVLAAEVSKRANMTLKVDDDGVEAGALSGIDIGYLTGSKELVLAPAERPGLKSYLAKGGFLLADAASGSIDFDRSFRALAGAMGWELKPFPRTAPIMTGAFPKGVGYNVATGVQFRHSMKIARAGRPWGDLEGIYQDGKLVGVYSPFDLAFSCTPYQADNIKGYQQEDAIAVAINILIQATDR
jgi:hypothetical protein